VQKKTVQQNANTHTLTYISYLSYCDYHFKNGYWRPRRHQTLQIQLLNLSLLGLFY